MIDHEDALIYTMVLVSAADGNMSDAEMRIIGDNVRDLPVFAAYERDKLTQTLRECADLLAAENGLDEAFARIKAALPTKLRETAYALACDVVAADGEASQEELRVLELIRHRLSIDRLIAAAIERGTRARFMTA
ncbi:MAG: tellurite resistance TerB family protein [Alphaproteobacteria bacterium]|nr:tellurite resistance TerB family protein [Alphaproteobacteria bacterium]